MFDLNHVYKIVQAPYYRQQSISLVNVQLEQLIALNDL